MLLNFNYIIDLHTVSGVRYNACMGKAVLSNSYPLIGRADQLDHLRSMLHQTVEGHGHICALVGEPGIGKTRIAEETADMAESLGVSRARGMCLEGSGTPPLWPWIQVLRQCLKASGGNARDQLPRDFFAFFTGLLPELLSDKSQPERPFPELFTSDGAQFAFFTGIVEFFRNVSESNPLLIILEDLQWADEQSLRILEYLAREIEDMHVQVLGSYRDAPTAENLPLLSSISTLIREKVFDRHHLVGFSEAEVSQFMHVLYGSYAHPHFIRQVHELTDGNPLFVHQLGIALEDQSDQTGEIELTSLAGLDAIVAGRLASLSKAGHEAVAISSLLSGTINPEHVARISDDADAESAMASLDEACSAHLLEVVPAEMPRYRFAHDLLKKLVEATIRPARKAKLHAKIACAMEETYRNSLHTHAGEIFMHYLGASTLMKPERAAWYAYLAGAQAMRIYDCERAYSYFTRGIECLGGNSDHLLRGKLLQGAGQAAVHIESIGSERGFKFFEEALQHFIDADAVDSIAPLLKCDELLRTVAGNKVDQRNFFGRILAIYPEDTIYGNRARAEYGMSLVMRDIESDPGIEMLNRSLEQARILDNTGVEMLVFTQFAYIHMLRGEIPIMLKRARQAIQLHDKAHDLFSESFVRATEIFGLQRLGFYDKSIRRQRDFEARAQSTGYPRALCLSRHLRIQFLITEGDWCTAVGLCRELGELAKKLNEMKYTHLLHQGKIALFTGDTETLVDTYRKLEQLIEQGRVNHGFVRLFIDYAIMIRKHTYISLIEKAGAHLSTIISNNEAISLAHVARATVGMLRHDTDAIKHHISHFNPRNGTDEWRYYAGVLHLAAGEPDEAMEQLSVAQEKFARNKPLAAWITFHLGEAYFAGTANTRRMKAVDFLRHAIDEARRLSMPPLIDRACRYLRKNGLEDIMAAGTGSATTILTGRELEVLTLITVGKQDKEVAAELNISVYTAHTHVRNILRKTGAGNRTEAARFAAENGLL